MSKGEYQCSVCRKTGTFKELCKHIEKKHGIKPNPESKEGG